MSAPRNALFGPRHGQRRGVLAALLVMTTLGLLWLLRGVLLAGLLEGLLDAKGLGVADVEVIAFNPRHLSMALHGSALGSIAHIDIDYRVTAAFKLSVERVRIAGAALQFAWRDGQLYPKLGGAGSGDTSSPSANPLRIPLELVDSTLRLRVGTRVMTITLAGSLTRDVQSVAALRFTVRGPEGQLHGHIDASSSNDGALGATLALDAGELTFGGIALKAVTGKLDLHQDALGMARFDGRFVAQTLATPGQAWGTAVLTVAQDAPSALRLALQSQALQLRLTTQPSSHAGGTSLSLDSHVDARLLTALNAKASLKSGTLELHADADLPAATLRPLVLLQQAKLRAHVSARATSLNIETLARAEQLRAQIDCTLEGGLASCSSPMLLALEGLELAAYGKADDALLAGPLSLDVAGGPNALSLRWRDDGGELRCATALTLQGTHVGVRGPLALRADLSAPQGDDGATSRGAFDLYAAPAIERPAGTMWLAPGIMLAGHYTLDAEHDRLLALQVDDALVSAADWTASALRGNYGAAPDGHLQLTVGELRNTRQPALLAPLRAELEARFDAARADLSATLTDASRILALQLRAHHAFAKASGGAHLMLQPIHLSSADALRALSPALGAGITDAKGEISLDAEAQWQPGKRDSALRFMLKDLALATTSFKVAQLNTELVLDKLMPVHSPAQQILSARLELPALNSVPLTLRFRVDDQHLRVEQARAELFGGAFAVQDGDIDIASGATQLALEVDDIDLASAFLVLNLEQLKGSGRLSGRLPLRFERGHIAVDQGQLQSSGAGVLQVGASTLTDQLKSYGKDVDLAFRALSDFHYRSFNITADKALLGPGKVLLHMDGNNPMVMDGHPFAFNISLETDFDYLAALLLRVSGLTNSALGWGAGQVLKPQRSKP